VGVIKANQGWLSKTSQHSYSIHLAWILGGIYLALFACLEE